MANETDLLLFSAAAILVNFVLHIYRIRTVLIWTLATAVAMAVLFRCRKERIMCQRLLLTAFVSQSTHTPLKSCL